MGIGGASRPLATAFAVALAGALAAAPLAWHQATVAGSCGLLALGLPPAWRRPVLAVGVAAAMSTAPPWSWAVVGPAILILGALAVRRGAHREPGVRELAGAGALALGMCAVVAAKQLVAARALPEAVQGVAPALTLGLAAAAAALFTAVLPGEQVSAEDAVRGESVVRVERPPLGARLARALTPERALALGLLVVAAGTAGRLARLSRLPPAERLEAAEELSAVPLVYDSVLAGAAGQPALLAALVRASPLRDEAALLLGVEPALAAGWCPRRADGAVVATARALERAGRGGEALRLLGRHPREGEVDGLRALFERTQGAAFGWRGGALGPIVPPAHAIDGEIVSDGRLEVEFTLPAPRSDLGLRLDGDAWNGPPTVDIAVDAPVGPSSLVEISGPLRFALGPLEAGPHRVQVTFINDAAGPGGDRNVRVLEIGE